MRENEREKAMRYAGIITAAGLSSRMRDFKPVMTVGDSTMLADIVGNYRFIGAEEIVAVGGYKGELLKKNAEILGISFAENPDYADTGMFESFCIGVKALRNEYDYVLVSPCDVPVISRETLRKLSEAEGDVIRPVCNGRGGHPLILSRKAAEKIAGYTGENGIQGAVRTLGFEVNSVEVDDVGILMDADTPEDFKALRKLRMEQKSGGSLWPDISVTIAKADTVLTPRIAQFLDLAASAPAGLWADRFHPVLSSRQDLLQPGVGIGLFDLYHLRPHPVPDHCILHKDGHAFGMAYPQSLRGHIFYCQFHQCILLHSHSPGLTIPPSSGDWNPAAG